MKILLYFNTCKYFKTSAASLVGGKQLSVVHINMLSCDHSNLFFNNGISDISFCEVIVYRAGSNL